MKCGSWARVTDIPGLRIRKAYNEHKNPSKIGLRYSPQKRSPISFSCPVQNREAGTRCTMPRISWVLLCWVVILCPPTMQTLPSLGECPMIQNLKRSWLSLQTSATQAERIARIWSDDVQHTGHGTYDESRP